MTSGLRAEGRTEERKSGGEISTNKHSTELYTEIYTELFTELCQLNIVSFTLSAQSFTLSFTLNFTLSFTLQCSEFIEQHYQRTKIEISTLPRHYTAEHCSDKSVSWSNTTAANEQK